MIGHILREWGGAATRKMLGYLGNGSRKMVKNEITQATFHESHNFTVGTYSLVALSKLGLTDR